MTASSRIASIGAISLIAIAMTLGASTAASASTTDLGSTRLSRSSPESVDPTPTPTRQTPAPSVTDGDPFGRALPWVVVGLGVMALGAAGFVLQVQIARERSSL